MKLLAITLVAIIMDWISGFVQAWFNESLESKKMREGLFHKAGEVAMILLGLFINAAFKILKIDVNVDFYIVVCSYLILTEIISIYENIRKFSPNLKIKEIEDIRRDDNDHN